MDKKFVEEIYFNREKEDNWDLQDQAEELGWNEEQVSNLAYCGYEVGMKVEFSPEGNKVLEIGGVDVSHLNITV